MLGIPIPFCHINRNIYSQLDIFLFHLIMMFLAMQNILSFNFLEFETIFLYHFWIVPQSLVVDEFIHDFSKNSYGMIFRS